MGSLFSYPLFKWHVTETFAPGPWPYLNNLVYPVVAFIPAGGFARLFGSEGRRALGKRLAVFVLLLTLLLAVRALLWIGYFDVDKLLLGSAGFLIGDRAVRRIAARLGRKALVLR